MRREFDAPQTEEDWPFAAFCFATLLAIAIVVAVLCQTRAFSTYGVGEWFALDSFVLGLVTLGVVGLQAQLAIRQTAIMKRQDELLSRRESLKLFLVDDYNRGVVNYDLLSAKGSTTPTVYALVVSILNTGNKTATPYYISLILPILPDGQVLEVCDRRWAVSAAPTTTSTGLARQWSFHGTEPIFPTLHLRLSVNFKIFLKTGTTTQILWKIISENDIAPSPSEWGSLLLLVAP